MVKVVVLMNGQVLFCTAPSLSGSSLVTPVEKKLSSYRKHLRLLVHVQ